jgi:hypothetical protein
MRHALKKYGGGTATRLRNVRPAVPATPENLADRSAQLQSQPLGTGTQRAVGDSGSWSKVCLGS